MATVDFSNAFNTIERSLFFDVISKKFPSLSAWISFTYGCAGKLYFNRRTILSTTGVQQGDPLGPLLFSLGMHTIVHQIRSNCSLLFMAWYLDDGTVIGPSREVSEVVSTISSLSSLSGLSLNFKKSELFWPSPDMLWNDYSLFHQDMVRNSDGISLLGSACSLSPSFIASRFSLRVQKALSCLERLSLLSDPHYELLLLRSCLGTPKLVYFLRTSSPLHLSSALSSFDDGIRAVLCDIIGFGGQGLTDNHWKIMGLPCRYGGLGILHAHDLSFFSFLSSLHSTETLQSCILSLANFDISPHIDFLSAYSRFHEVLPDYFFEGTNATSAFDAYYQSLTDRLKLEVASFPRLSLILSLSGRPHVSDIWFTLPI
jgi:hypothetical protein